MGIEGKRIFVVEDNVENRVIYQMTLVKHGAHLIFDRWGRDILRSMRGLRKFDLIILDLMLPNGRSGYNIFEEIRAIPELADIPVVAVSAADPSAAIAKVQELGFSGFITKPINVDCFAEQLERVMNGEKVWYAGDGY